GRCASSPLTILQGAKGLGERALQPCQVVGLAVMEGGVRVGAAGCDVAYVLTCTLDERPHVPKAFRVGHLPRSADADVDRRRVREDGPPPLVEVCLGAERPAGDPRAPADPELTREGEPGETG